MRKSFILLFSLTHIFSFAQERKSDTLVFMSGEIIPVFINSISNKEIIYSYPNEQLTYSVSKNGIEEIRFSSGRVEKINRRIIINSEKDWEKVITTTVPEDIQGLVYKGVVKAQQFTSFYMEIMTEGSESKSMEKIKRQAAKMGAHIILIESKSDDYRGSSVTGKAYGY